MATFTAEPISSAALVALPDAPDKAVPDDVRGFVRQQRLARPDAATTIAHLSAIAVAWAALAAIGIAIDSLYAWIPIWIALALLTATPIALMHEAVHHNLFRSRVANHAAGVIAATWMFFNGPAYRAWHLTHHAYTFTPDDSEQLPERFRSKLGYLGYCLILGPTFALILWFGAIATLLGKPPRWVRGPRLARHIRLWGLGSFVMVAAIVAAAMLWPDVVLKGWLVPVALGSVFLFPFLTMPEHYEGKGHDSLLDNTRTTVSNPAMRYLYWNNNFHTAHHLVPTVPPQSLTLVDEVIAPDNTLREDGFVRFHARVLRSLPWFPRRSDAPAPVAVHTAASEEPTPSTPADTANPAIATAAADYPVPPTSSKGDITISTRIDPAIVPELWRIYLECFEPLRDRALLCHVLEREVFESIVLDDRVFKVVGWIHGRPVGLAALTNQLELVPQISPPFLRRKYPEHAERNAILFGVFVYVDPSVKTSTMFARLIAGMGQITAMFQGVVACDVSQVNCDAGVADGIGRVVGWFPDTSWEQIDSQNYFAATFTEPLEKLPFSRDPMPVPVIDLRDAPATAEPSPAVDAGLHAPVTRPDSR